MVKNGLVVDSNGTKIWYINDKRHRTDGPAVEYSNGTKYWCINGKYHRTDGPAKIFYDNSSPLEWWLDGNDYDFRTWLHLTPISDDEKKELIVKYA